MSLTPGKQSTWSKDSQVERKLRNQGMKNLPLTWFQPVVRAPQMPQGEKSIPYAQLPTPGIGLSVIGVQRGRATTVGPLCLTPVMLSLCCLSRRALPDMFKDRVRHHYRTGFLNSILLKCETKYIVSAEGCPGYYNMSSSILDLSNYTPV